jgi:exoribonuclease-2
LYGDRFLFKYKEGRWVPNPSEVVANLQDKLRRDEETLRELETGAGWLKTAWETGEIPDSHWRPRLVELLRQMAVWGTEAPEFAQGKAYLEKARLTSENVPFRLLVRLGVFHEDENLDLYRLEVPQEFSAAARDLAGHLSRSDLADPYEQYREDLTHLESITIDGERTRDFDDALTLETLAQGWRLGIHIADVSALVEPGTPLDLEAQERGTSIYLPESRLAMLPEEISENTLSLLAQKERLALSFLVTLDYQGEIQDWNILPSRIMVKRRLSYQEADLMLPQDRMLATLYRLTQKLKEDRLSRGGYELKLPEVWVSFNHHGQTQVTVEDQETPSRQLVAEAMVLANWLAARFLADRDFPAIYRSQPEPREPIHREESKELLELWRDRRRLSRVVMELVPHPHWGLGLPLYTFATSPIRRYLDLVTHRQLHRAIQGAAPVYGADDLEEILSTIEPAMRRGGLVKARRLRYWLLKYLAGQVGQKMEVLVVEALPHRYRLLFPRLLLEVFLPAPASRRFQAGDLVQVRLDRVLPREDQVKLSLA